MKHYGKVFSGIAVAMLLASCGEPSSNESLPAIPRMLLTASGGLDVIHYGYVENTTTMRAFCHNFADGGQAPMRMLSATMLVFWTVAEGWILVALRWGFIRLRNRRENADLSLTTLVAVAFVAVSLALGRAWLDSSDVLHLDTHKLYFYRIFTWNLFCTLWVVLEALIALYSWRIYMILKGHRTVMPRNRNAIFTLVIASFGFYFCYHYFAWGVIASSEIGPQQIVNIGVFYIRLCGVFWILIESFIAILGFRTVCMLSQPDTAEG